MESSRKCRIICHRFDWTFTYTTNILLILKSCLNPLITSLFSVQRRSLDWSFYSQFALSSVLDDVYKWLGISEFARKTVQTCWFIIQKRYNFFNIYFRHVSRLHHRKLLTTYFCFQLATPIMIIIIVVHFGFSLALMVSC